MVGEHIQGSRESGAEMGWREGKGLLGRAGMQKLRVTVLEEYSETPGKEVLEGP